MVRGLDLFRDHFKEFTGCYILIGGAACDLVMEDAGLEFRATKDLDIILCIEGLTLEFAEALWSFIREGKYEAARRSDGGQSLYRFRNPKSDEHPSMLEFFSRTSGSFDIPADIHLTPIPMGEGFSSLSVILLDEVYYEWVRSSTRRVQGIVVADSEHLIPLKAHAWIDLRTRREGGESVDSKQIKKHHNDILRLSQIIAHDRSLDSIPEKVRDDLESFINYLQTNGMPSNIPGVESSLEDIIRVLRQMYCE